MPSTRPDPDILPKLPRPLAAIDRETLDALPVVPVLVYVDNQRNRYEFRTHAGTVAILREMDARDIHLMQGMLNHLRICIGDERMRRWEERSPA